MHPEAPQSNKGRETFLALTLAAVLGGAFVFFLNLVSLGIFAYVVAAVIGIAAVGYLHYVLWGHGLSQEVAGEREEEDLKRRTEDLYSDDVPRRYE